MLDLMGAQEARCRKLASALGELGASGTDGWFPLADALGNPVTPARLRTIVEGRPISPGLAARVERVLGKLRGWMDEMQ